METEHGKPWYRIWDPEISRSFEPVKSLPHYLRDTAISMPEKVAMTFYGYEMTCKKLDEAIDRFFQHP